MLRSRFLFSLFSLTLCLSSHAVLAQTSPPTGNAERDRGIELYRSKNFIEASKALKSAVKMNAADEQAWYYLGLALTQQPKELKNATKAFETAIKLKPNSAVVHAGLSYALLRRNKFRDAESTARTALKLEPAIASAHYVIAVVNLNNGAFEAALDATKAALRSNSNLAAAYLVKSEALWGLWAGPINVPPCPNPDFLQSRPVSVPTGSLTPEQLEARRRKAREDEALLRESEESLKTYLRLNPTDPSAKHWHNQLETLKIFNNSGKEGEDRVRYGYEVTTKARILAKPEPQYTEEARKTRVRGRVVLRAILGADGKVEHILVLRGLPEGLSWQAVEAARRVKFTPAMIDDKSVSMFVQMEYCFNLY